MEMDKDFFQALQKMESKQHFISLAHTPSKLTSIAKDTILVMEYNMCETISQDMQELDHQMFLSTLSFTAEDPHREIRLLNASLRWQSNNANDTTLPPTPSSS